MLKQISAPIWIILIIVGYLAFIATMTVVYPNKDPNNSDWEDRQALNLKQIAHLELGQSKQNILTLLGSPDFLQSFVDEQQKVEVLFYRTHHVKSDGDTTLDECTALLFKEGKLTAIGNEAFERFKKALDVAKV